MQGKITLITPPDIFENSNPSLLFINLSDQDQDIVSKWLAEFNLKQDLNFYVFSGEADVKWLFWAIGVCEYKYIDLDRGNEITRALDGYMLGKRNFYYKTANTNLAAIYSHITTNRVRSIEDFLERSISE
jgi:hypothetical protein